MADEDQKREVLMTVKRTCARCASVTEQRLERITDSGQKTPRKEWVCSKCDNRTAGIA